MKLTCRSCVDSHLHLSVCGLIVIMHVWIETVQRSSRAVSLNALTIDTILHNNIDRDVLRTS